jgi:hypothetical protein
MQLPDVRRLAALDMHGVAGRVVRKRLIGAEFVFATVGCLGLGLWLAIAAAAGGQALGAWLAGVGVNYAVLTWHAASLWPRDKLAAELAAVDVPAELRQYSVAQLWIVVPMLFAALAVAQRRSARLRSRS